MYRFIHDTIVGRHTTISHIDFTVSILSLVKLVEFTFWECVAKSYRYTRLLELLHTNLGDGVRDRRIFITDLEKKIFPDKYRGYDQLPTKFKNDRPYYRHIIDFLYFVRTQIYINHVAMESILGRSIYNRFHKFINSHEILPLGAFPSYGPLFNKLQSIYDARNYYVHNAVMTYSEFKHILTGNQRVPFINSRQGQDHIEYNYIVKLIIDIHETLKQFENMPD